MADTNKSRARLRRIEAYMSQGEGARLDRVVEASGESVSSIVRRALRRALPQIERELGIEAKGAAAGSGARRRGCSGEGPS